MSKTKIEFCEICNQMKEKNHWQKHHQPHKRPGTSEGLKRAYSKGRLKWNMGKNKLNNNSIKIISEKVKNKWATIGHPKGMKNKRHTDFTKKKMSLGRVGNKNGNWKGGLTLSVRQFRKSKKYQEWRKYFLEKSNGLCSYGECNKKAEDVHHIKTIKQHPELKLDYSNGEALCKDHHKIRHRELRYERVI